MNKSITEDSAGGTPCRKSSFSPITLAESPVAGMKQKGNLTGSSRIIRDNCAILCNASKKWNELNQVGADLVMKIINLKLDAEGSPDDHSCKVLYPRGLEDLVGELECKCDEMVTLVDEIDKAKGHLIGVEKLEKFQHKGNEPIFVSWPTAKFGQFAEYVVNSYRKELKVKVKVKEKIAHQSSKSNLMFYFTCWLYELYVDRNFKEQLYDMAMEVGFH